MRCDHGPPDRYDHEPPSACRECRRQRYRATSTRPRRRRSVEVDGVTRRYVALPPALVVQVDRYAQRRRVSAATALADLAAIGAASVLVDDAISIGIVSDPGRAVTERDR